MCLPLPPPFVPINKKIPEGLAPPSGQSRLNLNFLPKRNKEMVIPSGFMKMWSLVSRVLYRQPPNVPLQPLQAKQCDIEIAAHYSLLFHQNSINGKRDEVQNIQRKGRSIAPPVAETKLNVVVLFGGFNNWWLLAADWTQSLSVSLWAFYYDSKSELLPSLRCLFLV